MNSNLLEIESQTQKDFKTPKKDFHSSQRSEKLLQPYDYNLTLSNLRNGQVTAETNKETKIPVCYKTEFGSSMTEVKSQKKSIKQVSPEKHLISRKENQEKLSSVKEIINIALGTRSNICSTAD